MHRTGSTTLALSLAATALVSCRPGDAGATTDECPTPTTSEVRADAARASLVARVEVLGRPKLADGVTETTGLFVRVRDALAGTAAAERFVVWPGVETPGDEHLGAGKTIVAFLAPHRTPTTADGVSVTAYDIAAANGLLAVNDTQVARLCKGGPSRPTEASVLDGL